MGREQNAKSLSKGPPLTAPPEADSSRNKSINDSIQSQRVERLDSVVGGTDEFVDADS